ncbi:MAG TPA: polyprenol monophosphomannose synthase [Candidatus Acidoferrales bacterium]|nr:polyprenol monophosphomannose synthase [Candidatus Acidoferrales bacterium]
MQIKSPGKTLVIIPTYNEAENIDRVIAQTLDSSPEVSILVIDDNSPDGTSRIVEDISKRDSRVYLLSRTSKSGLGTAYVAGFRYAIINGYDYVMEMDADLSHDPADIPRFHEALMNHADVVVGSRYAFGASVLNWPMKRLLLSYGGNIFARVVTGVPVHDMTAGFKAFKIDVLKSVNLGSIRSNGYAFQVEMNVRAYREGFKIMEIPIVFTERREGTSKMSKKIVFEAMKIVLILGLGRVLKFLKRRKSR